MGFFNGKSMILKKFVSNENQKLSKLIDHNLGLSYAGIQKLIRNKDVKVNGKRISSDFNLMIGDKVEIYLSEMKVKVFYEDEDIIIIYKPRKIETVNEEGDDLKNILSRQIKTELYAVHRLDRNTEGLVIFAKNLEAKTALDDAIKRKTIQKFYLAKVIGIPDQKECKLTAYLKKDQAKSLVYISDFPEKGFVQINTNYRLIDVVDDCSILEVQILTGKTHQIRAHLSHIGYPILGDEKYGDSLINKKHNKKFQCLCAYKYVLNFEKLSYLSRLNGVVIELDKKEIGFL